MNKKTMILTALLAAGMLLTACGGSSTASSEPEKAETTTSSAETTTSAAETTASAAETAAAPAAESTKAPESSDAPADTTKAADSGSTEAVLTAAEAKEIMAALQKADSWGATLIEKDTEVKHEANGTEYFKVTDAAFKTTDDVRKYLNDHMTAEFISENYGFLLGGDQPFFIDVDGALYVRDYPRGYKYRFTDTEPTIEKTMEDGCTVYAFYDDMGQDQAVLLFVNKADGTWKLSGISFGM